MHLLIDSTYCVNIAQAFNLLLTFWQILLKQVSNFTMLSKFKPKSSLVHELLIKASPISIIEVSNLPKSKYHLLWLAFISLPENLQVAFLLY